MKPRKQIKARWRPDGISVYDLFGEVAVTHADVEQWVSDHCLHPPGSFRREAYRTGWDCEGKVRSAIERGQWPPSPRDH